MSVTLDLSDEVLALLQLRADALGMSIAEVIGHLAEEADAAASARVAPILSFIGLGESTSGRRASEADEMLAEGFGES